jgi:hypothetical protein
VAEALDQRRREHPPQVEEAPEPGDDGWLVLLDREDPGRSLIVLPARLSGPPDSIALAAWAAGSSDEGGAPATVPGR